MIWTTWSPFDNYPRVVFASTRFTNSVPGVKVSAVYRAETWKGAGPYGSEYRNLLPMHVKHYGVRPQPSEDGILALKGTEVCGFGNREDLDWWFAGYKYDLYRARFNVARYLVPGELIRYGGRQLVFERGDLLPIERYPMIRNGKLKR